jgi:hypothetical protein
MCDPVTALVATGTLVSAYGSFATSQAQASAIKANAAADRQQAYQNELDYRDQARTKLASQIAALSDRGVDISSGTPLALMRQSARNQEIDALRIRADGINKYNAQRYQASNVLRSGMFTAGGQLLMGAASSAKLAGLSSIGQAPLNPTTPNLGNLGIQNMPTPRLPGLGP